MKVESFAIKILEHCTHKKEACQPSQNTLPLLVTNQIMVEE